MISKFLIIYPFKLSRVISLKISQMYDAVAIHVLLKGNGVTYQSVRTRGLPFISKAVNGTCTIGNNFVINSKIHAAPTGNTLKSVIFIDNHATLTIGNNVGMSAASIICHSSIQIGDNVKLGAGSKILDTDFHSLDPKIRSSKQDLQHKAKAPVQIKNNAFIGAYSVILKGVTVGENSIVGAGSVVTKSIPDNQIWGGNPAKFIREIL